jgi:hypothetical protein
MRALAFFLGALAGSAAMPDRAWQWRSGGTRAALDLEPVALPPVSVPAVAVGAFALGAFAVGALAIGALAIGRLEVRKARLREVEIDSLTVRRFKVTEEPAGEPGSAES